MPTLSRRWRLIALAALLLVATGILLYPIFRPRTVTDIGPLDQPSSLPTVVPASQPGSGSPAPQPEVLVAVGDIGSCDGDADEALARLAGRLPGTLALLGDLAYNAGSADEYRACFDPAWGPMRSRMRPTPGNHEYVTRDASGYFDYFGTEAGQDGRGWYSYDLGAWHIVVLNSNCSKVGCSPGSPQADWLQADLAANRGDCLLAYWHHPRWSSGRHGSTISVNFFWETLRAAGVDVVLSGHDHTYERVRVDGINEFVVGTGGRSLYPFEKPELPQTKVRSDSAYGLLWMSLGPGTYQWEFLALGRSGFTDSGSGDCG